MEKNIRGRRGAGERTNSHQVVYEDFKPASDWTSDSNSDVLQLVDLIGFKKGGLNVVVDNGKLVVRGERQLSVNKYKRFKQVHPLPMDSDIEKISSKFGGGRLSVIIPKKEKHKEGTSKTKSGYASAVEMISRNKGTVTATILGLAVGIYLGIWISSTHLSPSTQFYISQSI